MATKRSTKKMPATVEPETKTKPVRVDLEPAIHKALRMKAAAQDMSMAALAQEDHLRANGIQRPWRWEMIDPDDPDKDIDDDDQDEDEDEGLDESDEDDEDEDEADDEEDEDLT